MKGLRWLPNLLTGIRLMLVVPVAIVLWEGRVGAAFGLLLLAGVTDLLDGFLAREFHWRSQLGAWLDPTADKLLIATVLFTLTVKGDLPIWFFAIVLFRDLGLSVGSLTFIAAGIIWKIRPYFSGKTATVTQGVALLVAMLQHVSPLAGKMLLPVLYVSAGLTILSSIIYIKASINIFGESTRQF